MKRLVITLLATSFALANFAAAESDDRPAPVDRHNVARRQAAPQQAARSMPAQAQRSMPTGPQQRSFGPQQATRPSPRFDGGVANQPRFGGQRFNGDASRVRGFQPAPPTPTVSAETNVANPSTPPVAANPPRDWRRGGPSTTDWRSRSTTPTGDQNLSGRNGRRGDWRNRIGPGTTDGVNGNTTSTGDQNFSGRGDWRNGAVNNGTTGTTADTAEARRGGHRGWHDRHEGDPNFAQEHQRYHERHDRNWWRTRYNRFALFGGGYYYWNSGFWYPAYGYDPYFTTYTYDAPIYGYNDQDPTQVMADVQAELARRGYYYGAIDGTFGAQTRTALLRFQRENGLAMSGIIDQPTLESLGFQ